jgi:hypothetical protein
MVQAHQAKLEATEREWTRRIIDVEEHWEKRLRDG